MGGIIRGDVVDSTDVFVPSQEQKDAERRAEEERRRLEAEKAAAHKQQR